MKSLLKVVGFVTLYIIVFIALVLFGTIGILDAFGISFGELIMIICALLIGIKIGIRRMER